jgi:3-oxoacyl-[acyl-carrier-protein] synthase II
MGFVTPLGHTVDAFDDALFNGRSAVRARSLRIKGLDSVELAVAACEFESAGVRSNSRLPLDRGTAMALAAACDAGADAGLIPGRVEPERLGIFWGSGLAGAGAFDDTTQALYGEQRRMRPTTVLTVMPNAAVAELALQFGAQGAAIAYACALRFFSRGHRRGDARHSRRLDRRGHCRRTRRHAHAGRDGQLARHAGDSAAAARCT